VSGRLRVEPRDRIVLAIREAVSQGSNKASATVSDRGTSMPYVNGIRGAKSWMAYCACMSKIWKNCGVKP